MKRMSCVGALLLSVAFLGWSCDAGGADSAVAEGHGLFKRTCATCHGPNAEGMPKLGKNLHRNEFARRSSDEELVAFLKVGRSASDAANERGVDMPPKGGNPALTDDDLARIVAYLRSIQ